MGKKPSGDTKDTANNLVQGADCVIHIAHLAQAELVTATASTLDYGDSEVEHNNITLVEHADWPMKRVADCPIAYLCKVHSTSEIGNTPQQLVFLEAKALYIDDAVVNEKDNRLYIDALGVNPLSRLGANQYASLGKVISKNRPK
jgi:flavin reductase (DIM6/NTAB) family NADH-FMN oxidoreductase RutF